MKKKNPLGEEKIYKLLLKFSLPAIVGMTVNSLYNVVDRIFIGNSPELGANGLAGITITFPLMILLLSMGILFGLGGSTMFSLQLGAGNREKAQHALGNAFTMLLVCGFLFMVLGQLFLKPILSVFGASNTIIPYSIEYMRVIFFGAIFQVSGLGMNNFIRADGNPRIAMYTMFLGAGLNILLDPLFIFVFKMGMAGAALATIIAQGVSFTWVLHYFLGKKCNIKLQLKYMKPDFSLIKKIIVLGLPESSLQIANSFLNIILNKSLFLYGGDIAVSAMGIINSLQTFLLLPIIGLRQGVQPIISFNYGANKIKRVKQTAKLGILVATTMASFCYIITRLFPTQLLKFFNQDPELLTFGTKAIYIWFLVMPVVGFQIIGSSFFQATGKSKSAIFLTLTRQVILLLPSLLIFAKLWQIDGLLYAAPFADFFSFLITFTWFYFGFKNLHLDSHRNIPAKKFSYQKTTLSE